MGLLLELISWEIDVAWSWSVGVALVGNWSHVKLIWWELILWDTDFMRVDLMGINHHTSHLNCLQSLCTLVQTLLSSLSSRVGWEGACPTPPTPATSHMRLACVWHSMREGLTLKLPMKWKIYIQSSLQRSSKTVTLPQKVCTSPRNSTWFTRPFLLVRGWGLGTRLVEW